MRTALPIAVLLIASCAMPAQADRAWTFLSVLSSDTPQEAAVPFKGVVVVRGASYSNVARLQAPYVITEKTGERTIVPAGEELFEVRTSDEAWYCSTKYIDDPSKDAVPITPGELLGSALPFGSTLMGGSVHSRERLWQCFRDADGDGNFEQVAGGERMIGMVPAVQKVAHEEDLPVPLAYEMLDKSTLPAKLEVGLWGSVVDQKAGRYRVYWFMRPVGGDTYMIPNVYETFRAKRLPETFDFLGGKYTITAIGPDATGEVKATLKLTKPVTAEHLTEVVRIFVNPFGTENSYKTWGVLKEPRKRAR